MNIMDEIFEKLLGNLIDNAIHDLYWSNSVFSSNEFESIVNDMINEEHVDACDDVSDMKKRLFKEIL